MAVVVTVAKGYDLGYIWKTQGETAGQATGGYYINAAQAAEPPGRWWGPGARALGLASGQVVERRPYDAVYQQVDPRTVAKHPRFHLHFTPGSSSWMNLVERWFAELTRRKLRRSAHCSVTELEAGIRNWISERDKDPRPFIWTKTAGEILGTLAAYCERVTGSRH